MKIEKRIKMRERERATAKKGEGDSKIDLTSKVMHSKTPLPNLRSKLKPFAITR